MCELVVIILLVFLKGCHGNLAADVYRSVLSDYVAGVRPQCVAGASVKILADFALRQIIELDEPRQLLYSILWIRLRWEDCRLHWNASNYGGIGSIRVPRPHVWIPDLTLYENSADKLSGLNDYVVSISQDGTLEYNFGSLIRSVCAVDVTYFPFDFQLCNLTFGSWGYGGNETDFFNKSASLDMSSYVKNSEWRVHNLPVKRKVTMYSGVPYPTLTVNLLLERRPLFYMCNLLFPCFLISSVAVLGFLLPPTSGEKVSLQITVLLSLSVFQLITLELIPPVGSLSFIGLYFILSMVLVGLSCLATVIVLNVHFKGLASRQLPAWIKYCLFKPLAKLVCVNTGKDEGCHGGYPPDIQNGLSSSIATSETSVNRREPELYTVSEAIRMSPVPSPEHHVDSVAQNGDIPGANCEKMAVPHPPVARLLENISQRTRCIHELSNLVHTGRRCLDEWHTLALVLDRLYVAAYLLFFSGLAVGMTVKYVFFGRTLEDWQQ